MLLWWTGDSASNGWKAVLACYALTAVLFGSTSAIMRHRDVRAQSGLARGENVLARWQIDEFAWRDFVAMNEALQAESDSRTNELDILAVDSTNDIDVTVGKEAIDFGGQIFVLPRRGTPEIASARLHESRVQPSYLEFQLKYPPRAGGASGVIRPATYSVLRMPVARSAVREAQLVAAHYNGDVAGTADFFHGTGDGADAEDLSTCWSCGFRTYKYQSECPRCGSGLQSRRWSRRFGLGLTICGVLLTGGVGALLYIVIPLLKQAGEKVDGTSFSGSAPQAFMVLSVLIAVFTFGATALGYGIWQMRTGRRSKKPLYIMLPIFVGLMLVAQLL